MPVTPTLDTLLGTIAALQKQVNELTRAVSRPSDQIRDNNDNVVHMVPGTAYPVLGARNQDVSVVLANGAAVISDGQGRDPRPLTAQTFNGPVQGDTTGIHHGDVGTPTEAHHHYGDVTGNTYGFHYGPVGDGTTQNQINATNVYANFFYGDGGVSGSNFNYNGQFWGTLHGTVVAPSESKLKTDVREYQEAGSILDVVPAYRWRWRHDVERRDDYDHIGPMIDDFAVHAPWLVRGTETRGYGLHDLVGVLWAALREERNKTAGLEHRISRLEKAGRWD